MPRPSRSARNRSITPQKRGSRRTPANLELLKSHIRLLEGFGNALAEVNRKVLPFGIEEIDDHLPDGGLLRGALHEIFATDAGIATSFCALLASRLTKEEENASILWCERPWMLDAGTLYGPALMQFGIDPEQLILVRAQRDRDTLWAMEEGLRCGKVAAVVGELGDMSLTASRRLQLAAEKNNITVLSIRSKTDSPSPSAAATRWRLGAVTHEKDQLQANDNNDLLQTAAALPGLDVARWQAEMFRCRGGASANWVMEWNDETGNLSLATEICNRPPMQAAARLAG